ncbi:esterase/lipase family protein [Rhodococcus sp. IEGM 1408]|uniref:esterase/lipase family protein n=1 Tax=Rhodococcus sp. IEGM 1408 TaxID=3082220 RepID=UPI0029546DFE|nr:alpha/beta fold hydrolase [Rhodococcus sp. IEGM 1408]MDV8000012.1 alpha/beta fold hydrolase [Rhodococcus sp. IEGM 1408]
MSISRIALALAVAALVVVPSTAAAAPATAPIAAAPTAGGPHPVPASFVDGLRAEVQNPGGQHPATNDWDCQLTEARPRPVILVHGTFLNRQDNWAYLAPSLANEGYCVFALTYAAHPDAPWPLSALGGARTMEEGAADLAVFVDRVRAATGAQTVDLVGHSQGTIMPAVYVNELGGHRYVENYVGLGSVWRGSTAFFLSTIFDAFGQVGLRDEVQNFIHTVGCGSCNQVLAGSEFFHHLWRSGTPYHPDVQYTNILTRYDEIVTPFTSGYVEGPNAVNHVVQDFCAQDFSEHVSIVTDPVARDLVLNALDPERPRAVGCEFVPPITPLGS